MDKLVAQTKALLQQNEENFKRYLANQKAQEDFDFYQDMKPFVDAAKEKCEQFLALAVPYVNKNRPLYLTETQLLQCTQNIQMTAVNCFNGKSFYKHFHDHYESSKYTLERMLTALERGENLE
ncbi:MULTISPECIES: DUF1798 family protein [Listeria]|uniref:DUF1798 family protein n=1 Tax=Listeria TaxID=1637 RepID=UPI000B58B866|nr:MULTISPECIES: DUF1798 family protein [Listeria]